MLGREEGWKENLSHSSISLKSATMLQRGLGSCFSTAPLVPITTHLSLFRSWEVWQTSHTPGSSLPRLSPTYPVALGGWWHHQGLPKGLHSSSWVLAGMRAGHSLSPWLPKSFPFPRHCGEKVTWLDTCLCQGCTQPDCCCDPWQKVVLLAGSPQGSSHSHRQVVTGRTSSDACASNVKFTQPAIPSPTPQSHLQ